MVIKYVREVGSEDVNWIPLAEDNQEGCYCAHNCVTLSFTRYRWFLIQLHGFSEFGTKCALHKNGLQVSEMYDIIRLIHVLCNKRLIDIKIVSL